MLVKSLTTLKSITVKLQNNFKCIHICNSLRAPSSANLKNQVSEKTRLKFNLLTLTDPNCLTVL